MAPLVKLVSSDAKEFLVELEVAKMSRMVAVLMEALNMRDADVFDKNPIPLLNVDGPVLEKILEWCNQHKNDHASTEDEKNNDVPECDKEFLKVELKMLFDLVQAAHYMEIQGLMDSAAKMIASIIRGKTTDEICKIFNIVNDCIPEKKKRRTSPMGIPGTE